MLVKLLGTTKTGCQPPRSTRERRENRMILNHSLRVSRAPRFIPAWTGWLPCASPSVPASQRSVSVAA